jgi:hypothetical protein
MLRFVVPDEVQRFEHSWGGVALRHDRRTTSQWLKNRDVTDMKNGLKKFCTAASHELYN